jgi:hypothetical protein
MKKKLKDKNTPRQKLYIYLFLRVTKSFHCVKRNVQTNLYSINLIITHGSRNRNYKKWEIKSILENILTQFFVPLIQIQIE